MARRTSPKAPGNEELAPSAAEPNEAQQIETAAKPEMQDELSRSLDANTAAVKALTIVLNQLIAQRDVTEPLNKLVELRNLSETQPSVPGFDKSSQLDEAFVAPLSGQGPGPRFNILAALKARDCFNDPTMDGNTSLLKYAGGNPAAVSSVIMGKINSSPTFQSVGVQIRSNDCTYIYYIQNLIDKIACIMAGMC